MRATNKNLQTTKNLQTRLEGIVSGKNGVTFAKVLDGLFHLMEATNKKGYKRSWMVLLHYNLSKADDSMCGVIHEKGGPDASISKEDFILRFGAFRLTGESPHFG
jgi:hypothetical protein